MIKRSSAFAIFSLVSKIKKSEPRMLCGLKVKARTANRSIRSGAFFAFLALLLFLSVSNCLPGNAFLRGNSTIAFTESINTFASDCSTPQSMFNLGNTVCAQVTGVLFPGQRQIQWIAPDNTIVQQVAVNSDPATDTIVIPTTGPLAQVGTWTVRTIDNNSDGIVVTNFVVRNPDAPSADLSILKFGPSEVFSGNNATYIVFVVNRGPDPAQNVVITDAVPANTTFISGTQDSGPTFSCANPPAGGGGTSSCSIASLPPDATAVFSFIYNVSAAPGTTVTNTASISSSTTDSHTSDNSWTATTTVASGSAECAVTCPPNVTQAANPSECGAVVNYSPPTGTGNCGAIICTPVSGSVFPLGATTVVCGGNIGDPCSFTVTVTGSDPTPPTMSCPSNITTTENPTGSGLASVDYATPTATDNCPGVTVACEPPSGTVFSLGVTTVTCIATDAQDNTTTCFFTVTVNGSGCALTCPDNIIATSAAGQCGATVSYAAPVTTGASCGTVSCAPPSDSFFNVGTTTVTCSSSDGSACSFTVTVGETTPPVITTCATNKTVFVGANCQAAIPDLTGEVVATDNCSPVTITQTPAAGTVVDVGSVPVTILVEDASGNEASCAVTVTVEDKTPPVITTCSAGAMAIASASCQAAVPDLTGGVTATDNCDPAAALTITQSPAAGTLVGTGTTTITLTVKDSAGNSSTCFTTFSVNDVTPPQITFCPPSITLAGNIAGACSASVDPGAATATDNCPGVVVTGVRSDSLALNSPYPLGITTITWTATDGAGNSTSCQQTVTVTNPAPVAAITGPESGAIFAVNTPVNFTGSFTDNAGGTHTAQWSFDSITQAGTVNETTGAITTSFTFTTAGVYFVKLKVEDGCGGADTTDTVTTSDPSTSGLTAMVVIYDPDGGFVTGGGWINSPAGAFTAQPTLTGKANFGFVSKYQTGVSIPTGQTEFQFKVANFNFHSTSYDWLVIAGAKAQYKGSGTVNGAGNYGFMLTAIDGEINGGGGVDKFRVKIWDKNSGDAIVYDNQMGAADSENPSTAIGGGSIIIHKNK